MLKLFRVPAEALHSTQGCFRMACMIRACCCCLHGTHLVALRLFRWRHLIEGPVGALRPARNLDQTRSPNPNAI